MLALLFGLQEAPVEPAPVAGPVRPPVAVPTALRQPCRANTSSTDVTVCGSRSADERYRLKPLPDRYVERPVRAAIKLNDSTTAAVAVHQQDYGSGFVSRRVSLDFSFLFGGKKKKGK